MSGPQLFDASLRTTQHPVDVATVGVGSHLSRDPGGQPGERLGQRAFHPEDALEVRQAHLHLLAERRATVRLLGSQQHSGLAQFLALGALIIGGVIVVAILAMSRSVPLVVVCSDSVVTKTSAAGSSRSMI